MQTEKKVDPRVRILKDLKEYVKNEIENKSDVVLLIDVSKGAESRTELIHKRMLIDTHLLKDPYQEIETYTRKRKD